MERAHRASTVVLSAALLLVGLAMIGVTLARGGSGLAVGVVVGAMLAAIGAGRLWLALRGAPR
ncbi:MAG TPA: hypothetical protein VK307_00990 [Thermoleophilaceae bacterium]|nr:hypothetical protein [Thermoleophilaceae bacterium]